MPEKRYNFIPVVFIHFEAAANTLINPVRSASLKLHWVFSGSEANRKVFKRD